MNSYRRVVLALVTASALFAIVWLSTARLSSANLALPSADIDVKTEAVPNPVTVGAELTFTVHVTNTSGVTLENLIIVDQMPSEVNPHGIFAQTSGGSGSNVVISSQVATFTLTSLVANGFVKLTITATVQNNVPNNSQLLNQVIVSATKASIAVNNSASVIVTVQNNNTPTPSPTPTFTSTPTKPAELIVSKSASSAIAVAGQAVTFTIKISNTGDVVLNNVLVVDQLPAGIQATHLNVKTHGASDPKFFVSTGQATFTAASLAKGGLVTLTLATLFDSSVLSGTVLTNQAVITATNDQQAENNQSAVAVKVYNFNVTATATATATPTTNLTATVTPVPTASVTPTATRPADLTITKSANLAAVAPGDLVTYTIVIANQGDALLNNLQIVDQVPAGVQVTRLNAAPVGATGSDLLVTTTTATYTALSLAKGGIVTLTLSTIIEANVITGTTLINTVFASADNDGNSNNNQATYSVGVGFVPLVDKQIYLPLVSR